MLTTPNRTEKVLDERRKNQRRELYSKRLDIYKTYSLYIPQYITKRKDIFSDIYILYISSYISQRKIDTKNFGMFVCFSL